PPNVDPTLAGPGDGRGHLPTGFPLKGNPTGTARIGRGTTYRGNSLNHFVPAAPIRKKGAQPCHCFCYLSVPESAAEKHSAGHFPGDPKYTNQATILHLSFGPVFRSGTSRILEPQLRR